MKNDMNICVFSRQTFWQGVKGGMELHGKFLSEGMVEKGNRVSVITTKHPSGKLFENINDIDIYYLKNTVFGSRRNGWINESAVKFNELNTLQPVDIIWSQSFDAYGLTFFDNIKFNAPIIPILQGCIQQELVTFFVHLLNNCKKPVKVIKNIMGLFFSYFIVQKRLLKYSDVIITASHQVQTDIKKWFGQHIANKCNTVFNGIDTKCFYPDKEGREQIRRQFGVSEKETLLLSAGRLVREKGHQNAIEVLQFIKRKHKHVKLMIVGDGSYRSSLEQKAREKGLKNDIIFTGFIENDITPAYYNSSDIFVLPTLREEGLPFVLLELMACEKPVIASQIGGNMSVVVDKKNGLFVPKGDVKLLLRKINFLIENPNYCSKLGLAARKTIIDYFSVQQMIERTLTVMHNIISRKKSCKAAAT